MRCSISVCIKVEVAFATVSVFSAGVCGSVSVLLLSIYTVTLIVDISEL